ncbi:hypothetical protein PN36_34335 [Candidatus Thiomargarita nelsonii]|uniref:Uncharacterized protein n=1 Tax=Candidatus Thiomargarita nelsonii TaxID=1003181 RepID=A0A4E0QWN8_9GAMM|nr:hypothetical protein PN36_34335 [Candidatus Thiomargarita nelsonii]
MKYDTQLTILFNNGDVVPQRKNFFLSFARANYATTDGTAGSDYTQTTGTLYWADGDSADKTITIAIGFIIKYPLRSVRHLSLLVLPL